jgi:hypothetical protein
MNEQEIAPGAIEPREHENFIAGPQIPETFAELDIDGQPRVRSTFISLLRRARGINERGDDVSDRSQDELPIVHGSVLESIALVASRSTVASASSWPEWL